MLFRNIEWNDGNEIESFVFTLSVFGFQRMSMRTNSVNKS